MWLLGVGLGLLGVWWLAKRAGELFYISVRDGELLLVRGRIPSDTLEALADVIRRSHVRNARLRAVALADRARLNMAGVDEFAAQRLRNTFALFPLQQLQSAPPRRDGNLGTLLGIEWLAWQLRSRRR